MDFSGYRNNCSDYIYSEDYLSFVVKYDKDIQGVYEKINPSCVTIINNQFLVAYRSVGSNSYGDIFPFGYNFVPKCFGLMDVTAVTDIGADIVRTLPGLALTGKDVIMGFVDTGIDYTSRAFRKADGSTRILALWDQNEEVLGSGEAIFGYGAEYSSEDINMALKEEFPYRRVPSGDADGHGTFLASVAAGSVDEDAMFTGIAPECDIIMVKLKPAKKVLKDFFLVNDEVPCFSEDDIILGVKYLINKAIEAKKPLIICMGIGTNQGDHNGNTSLELYFDTIVNLRGVCVVSPVGNELGARTHYSGNSRLIAESDTDSMEISVGADDKGFTLEIWGNAPGIMRCSILSPSGEKFDNIPSIQDGSARAYFLYEGTSVYIENKVVEENSGDQLIFMRFLSPAQGIWTINITETIGFYGRGFDAWLPIRQFLNSDTAFVRPDPDITLCAPGTGRGSITAAGYSHYTDALYPQGSRGYTRKGRIKPDITAPASNVYGVFARPGGSNATISDETLFTRRSGTSIASACVAGAACLLMEWGLIRGNLPGINTETIRQILIRGAKSVADVGYPNRSWGWGVLDLYGSFEMMRNT